ncbi:MAG: COG1887: Putative glycosyl/glycerophosphate transferases involved in teichoic acid biosynthesis TagF/TagB/EpsJ/RodC [uncultured Nocardioidaceae bacterium]|uniref:COG1887: Putative glycosyl/glycerophosphate transferases involved in teichoic acid biosynthesis TagF/TagB/EpsJ/RodC n=1 Tax=uncultured Nocardioidaceae bacterium TaxID=253824 RepID=A0A6J4KYX0_9ACTN|nr:MAG: COG1887: Putative glycosyl/glycerophosphate transferases involved in teichoic acid biosynthesis TagF/TagB/EpsJ/RodC [uncultured Nocardioidaceae bacterium]
MLVVLDELTGADADLVRDHAADDWRVRLSARSARGVPAGRNAGADEARGRYLTFVCSEDTLPPAALGTLVKTLEDTGSAFAFGQVAEVGRRNVSSVAHPAHESTRVAVALKDHPVAIADTVDENRLYRTDFWRREGLTFPRAATAGPTPAVQAFATGRTFDVLAEDTYRRSGSEAAHPYGWQVSAMAAFDEWLAHQDAVRGLLDDGEVRPDDEVSQAWAAAVCDVDAIPLLDDAERATPTQWDALRACLVPVRAGMTPETWARVRAESRVKVWLAVEGHRDVLEHFAVQRLFERGNRRTRVVDGRVLADFNGLESVQGRGVTVPADVVEMTERESALKVHVHGARWVDGERVQLDLFVRADFVSYRSDDEGAAEEAHAPHELSAYLVEEQGGRRVDLQVESHVDVEAGVVAGHRHQDYAPGATRVTLDASALSLGVDGRATDWVFGFVLTLRGISRTGSLTSLEERGSAGLLGQPAHAPRVVRLGGAERGAVALRADSRRLAVVHVAPPPRIVAEELRSEGRVLTGRLAGPPSGAWLRGTVVAAPAAVPGTTKWAARPNAPRVEAPLQPVGDGLATFVLTVPPGTPRPRSSEPSGNATSAWSLRVLRDGGELPVGFPAGVVGDLAPGAELGEVVAVRSPRGYVELWRPARTLLLDGIDLIGRTGVEPPKVRLRGRWLGSPPHHWRATLRGGRATVQASGSGEGHDVHAPLPLVWDEWGLGETVLPVGPYQVEVADESAGLAVHVVPGEGLVASLLRSELGADVRMTPVHNSRGPAVRLDPPLADDERGAHAQQRLQEWAASVAVGTDDRAVYLQSYTGLSATDSPRAIHEELRRSRPDLTPYWAVASRATTVPEGGVPLLMYSREWHRVLGSATYLVSNIDLDRWFRRKPHQRYLQTFHGFPSKSMGIRFWTAKHFTPRRIELELGRSSRDWTLILTPAPETDRYYREEYAYDGEIESTGYPRDDVLLSPEAATLRGRTRRLLGIAPHQTAVLYAPTWRDDLVTGIRAAELVRHLDLEAASARLGDDFVLLMRGHRFHTRAERTGRSARLVDVTDYPEINDLILASDAAVLDYSSLRFDFALTGRPMLFLVPDLESYTGGVRGFLHPFEESAPGPLLEDADDVVVALQDLSVVTRQYAAAYQQFNATFNRQQDGRSARRVVRRFFG